VQGDGTFSAPLLGGHEKPRVKRGEDSFVWILPEATDWDEASPLVVRAEVPVEVQVPAGPVDAYLRVHIHDEQGRTVDARTRTLLTHTGHVTEKGPPGRWTFQVVRGAPPQSVIAERTLDLLPGEKREVAIDVPEDAR
jgi:hypothetical protein